MRKKIKTKNKKGFTLIELIVVMVLMSMLLTMGFSIYRFSTAAYAREASAGLSQSDLRTAISVITKDMRKNPNFTFIQGSPGSIKAGTNSYTYSDSDKSLKVNDNNLITGISEFKVDSTGDKITITITGSKSSTGDSISYETTITRRQ